VILVDWIKRKIVEWLKDDIHDIVYEMPVAKDRKLELEIEVRKALCEFFKGPRGMMSDSEGFPEMLTVKSMLYDHLDHLAACTARKQAAYAAKDAVGGEEFIDEVISRINKKQIR
jgi:hypothetical protein